MIWLKCKVLGRGPAIRLLESTRLALAFTYASLYPEAQSQPQRPARRLRGPEHIYMRCRKNSNKRAVAISHSLAASLPFPSILLHLRILSRRRRPRRPPFRDLSNPVPFCVDQESPNFTTMLSKCLLLALVPSFIEVLAAPMPMPMERAVQVRDLPVQVIPAFLKRDFVSDVALERREPQIPDTQATKSQTGKTEPYKRQIPDTQATKSQTGNTVPYKREPQIPDTQATKSQTGKTVPYKREPQIPDTQATKSQTGKTVPYKREPQIPDTQATKSQTGNTVPYKREPQIPDTQATKSQTGKTVPYKREPQIPDTQATKSQTGKTVPYKREPQIPDTQATKSQTGKTVPYKRAPQIPDTQATKANGGNTVPY